MLAKKYRLPIPIFFPKRPIETLKSNHFLLKIFTSKNDYNRLGVIISKAVIPKPTARHKIKRVIFEFFRVYQREIPTKDFLLIVLASPDKLGSAMFREELKKIFFESS